MDTKSVVPETIISGFSHLLWLVMSVILLIDVDFTKVIKSFTEISAGGTILLAPIIFGGSFFLGTLITKLLVGVSSIFSTPPDNSMLRKARGRNKEFANELDMSWLSKSFFLSMSFALLLILIMAICLECKYGGGNNWWVIFIVGFPIEISTVITFFIQRNRFLKTQNELLAQEGNNN
jgi:hypothetical protein